MHNFKSIAIYISLLTQFHYGHSQTTGHILVVSNVQAKVIVDGEELGVIKPNVPGKFELSGGEHYLQVISFSDDSEQNEILTIEAGKQKVLKYEFGITNDLVERILVTDMDLNIPGLVSSSADDNFEYPMHLYAFEKGDEIVINLEMSNKKGTNIINIYSYPDGNVLYSNDSFQDLMEHKIMIKDRSIYAFTIGSNHAFDRDARLRIERIPESEVTRDFNTKVIWERIYSVEQVQKPLHQFVNSGSNATFRGGKSRISIPINLPANTVKWYYTFSAFREKEKVQEITGLFNLAGELSSLIDETGLIEFGLKGLTQPPGTDYCDVRLLDFENSQLFLSKKDDQWRHYTDGSRSNISSGIIEINWILDETLYLGIKNSSETYGINVLIEVAAIVVEERWIMSE